MRECDARLASYVYLMFGPEGKYPNRLEPQTLSALKEHMWKEINTWLDPAGEFQTMASAAQGAKYDIFPLKWGRMWATRTTRFGVSRRPVLP